MNSDLTIKEKKTITLPETNPTSISFIYDLDLDTKPEIVTGYAQADSGKGLIIVITLNTDYTIKKTKGIASLIPNFGKSLSINNRTFSVGGTDSISVFALEQGTLKVIKSKGNRIAAASTNDGTLDTSFAPVSGANADILTSVVQSDGKIIVGGSFNTYDGVTVNKIARLNTDGTLVLH